MDDVFQATGWIPAHREMPSPGARTISREEAVRLAARGELRLIDASWPSDDEAQITGFLPHTFTVLDVDAIKDIPVAERTRDRLSPIYGAAGIKSFNRLAVYDRAGMFSAPWAWWMLGDAGAPCTVVECAEGDAPRPAPRETVNFEPRHGYARTVTLAQIEAISKGLIDAQIIDARSAARFRGDTAEPRPGLASGHIPGSLNLPYADVLDGGAFKPKAELRSIFDALGVNLNRPIVTTCGSGVTACILAFAASLLDARDVRVYMASWSEYGASGLPVATGP